MKSSKWSWRRTTLFFLCLLQIIGESKSSLLTPIKTRMRGKKNAAWKERESDRSVL